MIADIRVLTTYAVEVIPDFRIDVQPMDEFFGLGVIPDTRDLHRQRCMEGKISDVNN